MDVIAAANDASFTARSVAYTGTAGSTSTWPVGPTAVVVWATTDAYIRVGVDVTATTADLPLPAYTPVLLRVPDEGDPWRVSAIQISAAGTVYAKPVNGARG